MTDPQITIRVSDQAFQEAKTFLAFLRRVARTHGLAITILPDPPTSFSFSFPGKDRDAFGPFLQELLLNRGLYYYLCGVTNRRVVARLVVKPIFSSLLDSYFNVTYPSLLWRHLLHGSPTSLAGDFSDTTGRAYEVLFHKLKLKMISEYEFVRDLDDLLTSFMLFQLEHPKGKKSPQFTALVDECGKQDILRDRPIRKLFNRIHTLRTRGLHRSERDIPEADASEIALKIYFFFEYLEDYWQAQDRKTVERCGKRYRRIRFGNEIRHYTWSLPPDFDATWADIITRPCHDCEVVRGELHLDGCDMELCPRCKDQYISCSCPGDDYDDVDEP